MNTVENILLNLENNVNENLIEETMYDWLIDNGQLFPSDD